MLLFWFRHQAKLRFLSEARKAGIKAYLKTVQGFRRLLVGLLLAFFMLQFMVMSAFGALITGFMLWDQDQVFKLQVLFGVMLGIFLVPLLVLMVLLSEKLWYRVSGAEKLIDDLNAKGAS